MRKPVAGEHSTPFAESDACHRFALCSHSYTLLMDTRKPVAGEHSAPFAESDACHRFALCS
jgi:hypothetical protein